MTSSSRLAVSSLAAASLFLSFGCGGQPARLSPQAIFVPKTDGDVQSRFSRIHDLETRLQSRTNVDLDEFRAELIAFADAVVETANSIMRDPKAADSQKSQAIEYAFKALEQRSEAAPKEALKRLAEEVDLVENLNRGTILATQASFHHVHGLDKADERVFGNPEERSTSLDTAIRKLASATPPHPGAPALLEELAQKAEALGDLKRERILYTLLTTHFPDEPLAEHAKRILNRLDLTQTVATDFQGVDENGKPVDLKDFRGKVVVVFYWSDQAEKKVTAMSEIVADLPRYPASDVVFVGINMDGRGQKALELAKQAGLTWVQVVTPVNKEDPLADQTPELASRYGIDSAPYYLVFDREGRLVTCGDSFRNVRTSLNKLVSPRDPVAKTAKTSH